MDETRELIETYFDLTNEEIVRNRALHRLQLIGDESIGLELLERAEGFSDYDKTTVVFSLRCCGDTSCSDKLLEWLEKSKVTELTTAICEVLGHVGKIEAIVPLLRLLDDERTDVVFWAASGIEMMLWRFYEQKIYDRGGELWENVDPCWRDSLHRLLTSCHYDPEKGE